MSVWIDQSRETLARTAPTDDDDAEKLRQKLDAIRLVARHLLDGIEALDKRLEDERDERSRRRRDRPGRVGSRA